MSSARYDQIGTHYDSTRRADPFLSNWLIEALGLEKGARVLDLGCGTGNYSVVLAEAGLQVTGLDPSERMLDVAREKAGSITWTSGRAEAIPFPDAHFDGVSGILTTHHWSDLEQGLRESRRVLRPGGRLVLFTADPDQMRNYWMVHYFPEMIGRSCAVMPDRQRTRSALRNAGFTHITEEVYHVRPDLQDHFLYAAKNEPERYLDATYRLGISSFRSHANAEELERGLRRLELDLKSGAWVQVRDRYDLGLGDYLWFVAG